MLFSCHKKEETKPVQKPEKEFIDDPLVYEVINAVLEMPEISEYIPQNMLNLTYSLDYVLKEDREEFYKLTERYFGENDTLHIYNQIEKSKTNYYKEGYIKDINLIDYDLTKIANSKQLDSLNQSLKKYRPYCSISYPIFNKHRNMVFISYGDDGFAKWFFMKKISNKWTLIEVYHEILY